MLSSHRTMFSVILVCLAASGCVTDVMDPGTPDGTSASITKVRFAETPVSATVPDSQIAIGDTVRVRPTARNLRTLRDVTREVKFTFTSSDTLVAVVDRRGLVTGRRLGSVRVTALSALGSAVVRVGVGPVADSASGKAGGLAALPDTQALAPPPAITNMLGNLPPMNLPMLPADTVDASVPPVTGRTIRVSANDPASLQAALNSAVGGDQVVLPDNSEYVGNFTLPRHAGSGAVTVRSETVTTAAGTRVTPAVASSFARIITPNVAAAVATAASAANWHLLGLSISLRPGAVDNYGIVTIGTGSENALSQFASNIVLDRVMINGGVTGNTSRCVGFNGNSLAVVDSWLAECHAKGRDAQAIGGWSGLGPFLIQNNHLEGSGQNIMFGGADPAVANVSPSDITIRGNHLFKPMSWGNGKWTVKASFELKHAKRLLFENNVIENHWADAQVGFAILIQAANQDNTAPWSIIQDITIRSNIIRNSTSGFNLLSRVTVGGRISNQPTKRVLVRNNIFTDIGHDPVTGAVGRYVQLMSDHEDVSIVENTFVGTGANNAVIFDGEPSKRLTIFNNVFGPSAYGFIGSGFGEGTASIAQFAPGALVRGNVLAGHIERLYPASNFFPAALQSSDFMNAGGGDFTLRQALPFSASDGALVGADGQSILAATRRTITP